MKIDQKGFSAVAILLVIVVLGAIAGAGYYITSAKNGKQNNAKSISNFDECVAAGNPVMESLPEQCSADGKTFTKKATSHSIAHEGLIVTYNSSDWKVIEPYDTDEDGRKSAGISLSSDVFQIGLAFGLDGKGGFTCFDLTDFNPATCSSESKIVSTVQLNGKTMNVVAHKHKEPDSAASYALYLTDKSDCKDAFNCSYPAKFQSFADNSVVQAGYSDGRTFDSLDVFVEQPEVKQAIEIFTTLRY